MPKGVLRGSSGTAPLPKGLLREFLGLRPNAFHITTVHFHTLLFRTVHLHVVILFNQGSMSESLEIFPSGDP